MSGFDPDWLALREPVDHAARNREVAAKLRDHFAGRASLVVVDLGCGTGSNLRALAPLLPARQHWHLVDGDAVLLAEARRVLSRWADSVEEAGTRLLLTKGGQQIAVSVEAADLTVRDLHFRDVGADLVTAAALFDLVSGEWLEQLVAACAQDRVPLYSVLNYDGVAAWQPALPLDARIIAAFNRHQRGDKGFGPALGPASGEVFGRMLAEHGYRCASGDSPWRLGREDHRLAAALAAGFAQAAIEIAPDLHEDAAVWARARADAAEVTIGHTDIFAVI
ncbi:class I SAM-dependent methyltransferase [Ancylobacter radicis]|uniref:Class I SAM-dependent methyltransferase n=1 Tax=Ancylobacter radicis TaxID=2836179 RepID=A0ABS5RBC6_9HYPH|nr:class I SAM-dependent methyltransferase [Ancylobacter radicis]MBS9478956.1 class I SAM-dependent methyltransferase [Ancylobacter radicis]